MKLTDLTCKTLLLTYWTNQVFSPLLPQFCLIVALRKSRLEVGCNDRLPCTFEARIYFLSSTCIVNSTIWLDYEFDSFILNCLMYYLIFSELLLNY